MLGWAASVPRVAWVLFAALPLLQLTISATGPVVPEVREAFGLSYAAVGVFVSSLNLVRLLSDLPAGQLATRFNGRSLVGVSAVVTVLGCLLGSLAGEYWQLLVARAVLGATTAINQAVIMAWLIRLAGRRNRALVMGLQDAAFSCMVVFVPPLSGLLAGALSWRAPFVLGGLSAAVAGGLIWAGTRREQADAALRDAVGEQHGDATAGPVGEGPRAREGVGPHPGEASSPLASGRAEDSRQGAPRARSGGSSSAGRPTLGRLLALGGPTLVAAYALTFAVYFGRNALLQAYLPLLGGTALGMSAWSIGLAIGGQSLFGAVATVGAGLLSDRFGRAVVLWPGFGLLLLAQAALLLVRDVEGFYAVVLFQSIGFTLNALPASLVGDALPRAYGSLGIAGYRLVADTAILAAPLVMGVALDYTGYHFPVVLLLAETALCATVALVALRRGQPTRVLAQG